MYFLNGRPATVDDMAALALTNYGHFTSMRVDDGAVRGLSLHLERLEQDCEKVFGVALERDSTIKYIQSAAEGHEGSFTMRVTVFDPGLGMGNIGADPKPHVLVSTRPAGAMPPAPLTARTFAFARDDAQVKHVGLYGQLRLRREAVRSGFGDAIFVEDDGRVSEGATWNLGFVTGDGSVVWPDAPVLPGVTMRLLHQVRPGMTTGPVRVSDLSDMRAAFATNTSVGVRPLSRIDDVELAVHDPEILALQQVYSTIPGESLR